MAACTNEKPCGKPVLRWVHSPVCQKLTAQGKVLKERPGAEHVATLKGRAPAKFAKLPDGGLLVAQADAPPQVVKGTRAIGCGCGAVLLESRSSLEEWDGKMHRYGLPCYPKGESKQAGVPVWKRDDGPGPVVADAPERANREGDQALPTAGAESVFAEAQRRLAEREALGVKRYGRSLETFNGRDAFKDAEDELLDGYVYLTQIRMEHRAVVEALVTLAKALLEHGGPPRDVTPAELAALDLAQKLEVR